MTNHIPSSSGLGHCIEYNNQWLFCCVFICYHLEVIALVFTLPLVWSWLVEVFGVWLFAHPKWFLWWYYLFRLIDWWIDRHMSVYLILHIFIEPAMVLWFTCVSLAGISNALCRLMSHLEWFRVLASCGPIVPFMLVFASGLIHSKPVVRVYFQFTSYKRSQEGHILIPSLLNLLIDWYIRVGLSSTNFYFLR